jgi:hypothetical protein
VFDLVEDLASEAFKYDPDSLIVVEPDLRFPGTLAFQSFPERKIIQAYPDFISQYSILNELFMVRHFVDRLKADGANVLFDIECKGTLEDYERWNRPLEIENFTPPGNLYEFQRFGINRAVERSHHRSRTDRFHLFGWGTGTGKTLAATGGAQELFNRHNVDVVLAFTLRKLKINFCRAFEATTSLDAFKNDHDVPATRHARYFDGHQVYILNYDKAHHDVEALTELVRDKRVLFCLDEVQKVLTEDRRTRARRGLDILISKAKTSTVWPMSASVVGSSPHRYRDLFLLDQSGGSTLGSRTAFEQRYLLNKRERELENKHGGVFILTTYNWDHLGLHEVRHLVSDRTQNARKSDPGIREEFKELHTIVVPVQMSSQDRRLYRYVEGLARDVKANNESPAQHYELLRYICNSPENLRFSESKLAAEVVAENPKLCSSNASAKLEMFLDQVEGIRDADDKVVVFTHWTNMSLFLLERKLRERGISVVVNHGDLSDRQAQKAEDDFKSDPSITVFLSSDAGTYGLNLQVARYVINYEAPFHYDELMQRINRIHRIDSTLENMTAYIYCTENSIEERILDTNDYRRMLSSDTTGATEVLSYTSESDALDYLLFGS